MAIDSYRFPGFAWRQVMKARAERQMPGVIPFAPLGRSHYTDGQRVELLQTKPWLLANLYSGRIPHGEG